MLKTWFTMTAGKWLLRRLLEIGGMAGLLMSLLAQVDPAALQSIFAVLGNVLSGRWTEVNLAAIVSTIGLLGGLIWNARSTFTPHVTTDGQRVSMDKLPSQVKTVVAETAQTVVEHRKGGTIFERMFGKQ